MAALLTGEKDTKIPLSVLPQTVTPSKKVKQDVKDKSTVTFPAEDPTEATKIKSVDTPSPKNSTKSASEDSPSTLSTNSTKSVSEDGPSTLFTVTSSPENSTEEKKDKFTVTSPPEDPTEDIKIKSVVTPSPKNSTKISSEDGPSTLSTVTSSPEKQSYHEDNSVEALLFPKSQPTTPEQALDLLNILESKFKSEKLVRIVNTATTKGETALHYVVKVYGEAKQNEKKGWAEVAFKLACLGANPYIQNRDAFNRTHTPVVCVIPPESTPLARAVRGHPPNKPSITCGICADEIVNCEGNGKKDGEGRRLGSLSCGHKACFHGIGKWIDTQIKEGKVLKAIRCFDCTSGIDIYDVRKFADPKMAELCERTTLASTLANMPGFLWCPSCQSGGWLDAKALEQEDGCPDATCIDCKHTFCSKCSFPSHKGKCQGNLDKDTISWMKKNTKKCPGCKSPISRKGGCTHMTCSKCKYQFCWICLSKYNGRYNRNQDWIKAQSKAYEEKKRVLKLEGKTSDPECLVCATAGDEDDVSHSDSE
ncbi:hypothetical protein AAMO2058_000460500 [Amorphochlora amoebiformis]